MSGDLNSLLQNLTRTIEVQVSDLWSLWSDMGLASDIKKSRIDTLVSEVENLLTAMVGEERHFVQELEDSITDYRENIQRLSEQLKVMPGTWEEPKGSGLIRLADDLYARVQYLEIKRDKAMEQFNKIRAREQRLCEMLEAESYELPPGVFIPSPQQVAELEAHVNKLLLIKDNRLQQVTALKEEIVQLLDITGKDSSDFTVIHNLTVNLDSSFIVTPIKIGELTTLRDRLKLEANNISEEIKSLRMRISNICAQLNVPQTQIEGENHISLDALKKELLRCEELRSQNLGKVIISIREMIVKLWDVCHYTEEQRGLFTPFSSTDYSDDLLELHELEHKRLTVRYENSKEVLSAIAHRSSLWQQHLEFMEKARDPRRFQNRGGQLLQEQKRQKKVERDLPRAESDLKILISKWEERFQEIFRIDGKPYLEIMEAEHEDVERRKENERQLKQQLKRKPATPPGHHAKKSKFSNCSSRYGMSVIQSTPQKTPLVNRQILNTFPKPKVPKLSNKQQQAAKIKRKSIRMKPLRRSTRLQKNLLPVNENVSVFQPHTTNITIEPTLDYMVFTAGASKTAQSSLLI